jgi:hypothetical protein
VQGNRRPTTGARTGEAADERTLIDSLVTTAKPRYREIEAARAKARSLVRFGPRE